MAFRLHPYAHALLQIVALLGLLALVTMPAATTAAKKPKKLHFYMLIIPQNLSDLHNPLGKYNAVRTGAPVIVPDGTFFGVLNTFDTPISKIPSIADKSDILGRIQGWYGDCGQDYLALCFSQTFTYDDGVFSGTFSLIGVDVASTPYKEAPIVGGTGDFAYCRGIAGQRRISDTFINEEENAWFEYNVTLRC